MDRLRKTLVLLMVAAIPAPAPAVFQAAAPQCFTVGPVTYRLSSTDAPDYRVRFDNAAAPPDLRVGVVESAATADFVLVDDIGAAKTGPCRFAANLKTIRIGATKAASDLTVSMSDRPTESDYRIYVNSARFSPRDAAPLLAVMTRSGRADAARH